MTEPAPTTPPAPVGAARAVLETAAVAGLRFDRDRGFEKAASLAYSSLLALIPAILLGLSVVEVLAPATQDRVTDWFLDLLFPREAGQVREGFRGYFEDARRTFGDTGAGTGVRVFSILLLVYFAASLLTTVDRVVADVWGGGGFRAFLRRLSGYWAVITLGPFLLALSFAGTALAGDVLGPSAGETITRALPFVVTSIAVFLFYRLMPHSPVRSGAAFAGAAVAGVAWEASKLVMGWWFARPKTTMLATLSFFPAALLWMYVSWVIGIYGLEVAYVVHHRAWRDGVRGFLRKRRAAARDAVTLAVAVEIARAHDEGRAPDRADLADLLRVPENAVAEAIAALSGADLVEDGPSGGFRPARGAAGILALEVVAASRGRVEDARLPSDLPSARAAHEYLRRLERDVADRHGATTLADLAREARDVTGGRAGPPAAS